MTTLVLEMGSRSSGASPQGRGQPPAPAGVYFRTNRATVIDDAIDRLIPLAHQHGLAVHAVVTLRQMDWLKPALGWADRTYDPVERQFRRSAELDLFHPGFQVYLTRLLTDLAETGIDGLVFRADAPMGPTQGFSPYALDRFQDSFGIQLDPSELFPVASGTQSVRPQYPSEFWRWAGWKARERLKVMERLAQAMRRQSPKLKFAIEVHPEAIHDPVEALVWYGEDLLEVKHGGFDYVIVRTDKPLATHTLDGGEPGTPTASARDQAGAGLMTRLIEVVGDPKRVWVTKPLLSANLTAISYELDPQGDRAGLAKGIGLLYMKRVAPVP